MRARLIDGAIAILERSGADGLSTRALAKETGASVSAANYSFGGRQGLMEAAFRAVFDRALAWWREQATTCPAPGPDPQARAAGLTALLLHALRDEALPRAALQEALQAAARDDAVRTLAEAYRRASEDVWADLSGRLGFAPAQAPLLRLYVQGILAHGHWADWTLHGPWLMDVNRRLVLRFGGTFQGLPGWEGWAGELRRGQGASALETYLDPPAAPAARILAASAAVIADHGLESLTHRAVAETVGCTPTNVVYHFPSRDVLVDQTFAHIFRTLLADGAPDLGADPSALPRASRIEGAIDQVLRTDGQLDSRQMPVRALWLESLRRPQMRVLATLLLLRAESAIEHSLQGLEGSGDPAGPLESHVLLMVINGGIQDALSTPPPERRAIWRQTHNALLDTLFGPEDSAGLAGANGLRDAAG